MGLDEMVHNAKYGAAHGTAFMLDVFQNGARNECPAHDIYIYIYILLTKHYLL
jgi:hypothetical protein